MKPRIYSPRLDIAVGPFSVLDGVKFVEKYDRLFDLNIEFLRQLIINHLVNISCITEESSGQEIEHK
jgi:hypothetical protein